MSDEVQTAPVRPEPKVRSIGRADVVEALAAGLRDLQAAPLYGLGTGLFFAGGGAVIVLSLVRLGMPWLAYPLAAGFALLGPFLALGLYEVSRRLRGGEPLSPGAIYATVRGRREIAWMAFVTLFIFIMWMYQVRLIIALFLGVSASFTNIESFLSMVLGTPQGLMFLAVGNVVGAVLSIVMFSLTVVSFPLLLERDVDFVTAMITSVRAVAASPRVMVGWAAVVTLTLMVSMLPMFIGLVLTLPVLGHTTWHLYRRVVVPEDQASIG
jgi:uncharacterized membrane protein